MKRLQTRSSARQRQITSRRIVARISAVALLATVFCIGVLIGGVIGPAEGRASGSFRDQPGFATLQQVWELIHENFADPDGFDDQELIFGAARGMVESLDDPGHSSFLDPEQATAFRASLAGELVGLGISLEYVDDEPVIVAPLKNSPAETAGLLPGDVIVEIDGIPTLGMTDREVGDHLRGDAGTPVTLSIERDGNADLLSITVIRALIELDPVTWGCLSNGIAIVQLRDFSDGAAQRLHEALQAIKTLGPITGIVFDLRNNPGGLVPEALMIAGQFMPEGSVLYIQQERDGQQHPIRTIGNDGLALDVPIVVLVNRASASAAEMLAGSLRDNGRAVLVGERTYGTGTVVSTFGLDDGSALALGTSFWKTPDGDLIWKTGLIPDTEIRQTDASRIIDLTDGETIDPTSIVVSDDVQLQTALAILEERNDGVSS